MKLTQELIGKARREGHTFEHYRHASRGGWYTDHVAQGERAISVQIRISEDGSERINFDHNLRGRISRAKAEKILGGMDWREACWPQDYN
jgi:hypothetical protein